MRGRFDQHRRTAEYAVRLGLPGNRQYGDLMARYNVAPSETPLVARWSEYENEPELVTLHSGLVPHWSKDPSKGPFPINARAETVAEKPLRLPGKSLPGAGGRLLRVADGEWAQAAVLLPADQWRADVFRRSGSRWRGQGQILETFTIIITEPNALAAHIHNRMPAILPPEHHQEWLDPLADIKTLQDYLVPYNASEMECFPVSTSVNKPQNKGSDVIAQVGPLV
ncbi:SOS response-associated peptidase [Thiohalomonas denitrificans]|uniref:Abasic site processing protein n=1 Tax=Thiohalomonas denitrificans TaxID=415747 RepID=A0A1G5QSR5_9GAMM|nr:SOS response-associated peptidase [Thiohalomonas denitrificans]SCZ64716.1 Putative SOS response-associated peptidase YedK [Thiohalomonas denitrificans]